MKPTNMKYLLTIVITFFVTSLLFAQQKTNGEVAATATPAKKASMTSTVLYLLAQGDQTTEISKEEFRRLKKKDIEYTKMIKDPVLLSMYGDKAKSGVVLIHMKQSGDDKKKKSRADSALRKPKQKT